MASPVIMSTILKPDNINTTVPNNTDLYCGRNDCPGNPINQTQLQKPEQVTVRSILDNFKDVEHDIFTYLMSCQSNPPKTETLLE